MSRACSKCTQVRSDEEFWESRKECIKCSTARRKYRARHKEKILKYQREYYRKDPSRYIPIRKTWRTVNADRQKQVKLEWKRKNRHKLKQFKHSRRAREASAATGIDCTDKIKILGFERFCRWCCRSINKETMHIDHIIPLSRGGMHAPDNLAATCRHCNLSKGNRLIISEWIWDDPFFLDQQGGSTAIPLKQAYRV